MDLNKRLLIAIALSVAILFGFNYLFPVSKKRSGTENNLTKNVQNSAVSSRAAPSVEKPSNPSLSPIDGAAPSAASSSKNIKDEKLLATVKTDKYTMKIDHLGRITSVVLHESKYTDKNGKPLDLIDSSKTLPLEIRFKDENINDRAFKVDYVASSENIDAEKDRAKIVLRQDLGSLSVSKEIVFYPDGHYDISVNTSDSVEFFMTTGHRPEADKSKYMIVRGALVRDQDGVITTIEDGKAEEPEVFPQATIVSSFDRYYASLFYSFDKPVSAVVSPENGSDPLPFVSAKGSLSIHGYTGPKEWKLFGRLDGRLTDAIEFGWFTFLSKPFFKVMLWMYNFVGNWGWAIVMFTILVKLVLFPLSYKGMMSMQKLKDLAPKMKEIKERYGKDPAKMNQQMMELYRKHGANPMGGCLPMLLQIPVFFALYRVLLNADELQGAPWILWINDLSRQDPWFVLPLLMGVTMYLQQKITPSNVTDPMQQKIFKWFPVIMTFFFLTFPSGLVLYWLTNNILSIAQQYFINRAYERHKEQMKSRHEQELG